MSLADAIKNSFEWFKKNREPITPDLYRKVFCDEAKKLNIGINDCGRVEKYIDKLDPSIKKLALEFRVRDIDELLVFLISQLNRYGATTKNDTVSLQTSLIKLLLTFIEKIPIDELKNEARYSLSRDLNHLLILQNERERWQKIIAKDYFALFNNINEIDPKNRPALDLMIKDLVEDKSKFDDSDIVAHTDRLNNIVLELKEMVEEYDKEREKIVCDLDGCNDKKDLGTIIDRIKNIFVKPEKDLDKLNELTKKTELLKLELDKARVEAHEDFVTKTLNRRGLNKTLFELEESRTNYSTIFMQIDKYEELLMSLGRKSGEVIQHTIVNFIKNDLDERAEIGRFGGNTFMIILQDMPIKTTLNIAQNIVDKMPKKRFIYEDKKFSVTLSMGVAIRSKLPTLQATLIQSDKMLTVAKNSGGNRVAFE